MLWRLSRFSPRHREGEAHHFVKGGKEIKVYDKLFNSACSLSLYFNIKPTLSKLKNSTRYLIVLRLKRNYIKSLPPNLDKQVSLRASLRFFGSFGWRGENCSQELVLSARSPHFPLPSARPPPPGCCFGPKGRGDVSNCYMVGTMVIYERPTLLAKGGFNILSVAKRVFQGYLSLYVRNK